MIAILKHKIYILSALIIGLVLILVLAIPCKIMKKYVDVSTGQRIDHGYIFGIYWRESEHEVQIPYEIRPAKSQFVLVSTASGYIWQNWRKFNSHDDVSIEVTPAGDAINEAIYFFRIENDTKSAIQILDQITEYSSIMPNSQAVKNPATQLHK